MPEPGPQNSILEATPKAFGERPVELREPTAHAKAFAQFVANSVVAYDAFLRASLAKAFPVTVCPHCGKDITNSAEVVVGEGAAEKTTRTWEKVLRGGRCCGCSAPLGSQHNPRCYRQGLVTEESDLRSKENTK